MTIYSIFGELNPHLLQIKNKVDTPCTEKPTSLNTKLLESAKRNAHLTHLNCGGSATAELKAFKKSRLFRLLDKAENSIFLLYD